MLDMYNKEKAPIFSSSKISILLYMLRSLSFANFTTKQAPSKAPSHFNAHLLAFTSVKMKTGIDEFP